MHEKIISNPQPAPADEKPIPQPATDGFPVDDDVSIPPPGSDQSDTEEEQ